MTDRVKGFTVALNENVRIDDVESLRLAMLHLNGVLDVQPLIHTPNDWIVQMRVRRELGEKLWQLLYPKEQTP